MATIGEILQARQSALAPSPSRSEKALRDVRKYATLTRTANDPIQRARAELLLEKLDVDNEIREIKSTLRATVPRRTYYELDAKLCDLQKRSAAIQTKLGKLRQQEKDRNIANEKTRERLFIQAVRRRFGDEVCEELWAEVDEAEAAE